MSSAYIEIPRTTPRLAAYTGRAIDQLQIVVNEFDQLKSVLDQVALGDDWASLASKLGLSQSDAQAVYNLIGSVQSELHATFITQLLGRCG